ncbi:formate--tetrahydrofolate ligase [Clostridia bacterium]|nr:formate--tetrahydrofolate ligase [Clostridia bacterium]
MLTDIEIAREAKIKPIREIAESLGLDPENDIEPYGRYKAKLSDDTVERLKNSAKGKLILVTAISPTKYGEGKTTMSVGLGQALAKLGKKTVIALREPSLGPVFGIKGGAAGGGYSQVLPMEDINLHFTGDFHAITAANNLLSAAIDNVIHQGNELKIDPARITFTRCMDMNDRALREVTVGLGKRVNGVPRMESFRITAASEIMAIFCLASDLSELKEMLGNIAVGYTFTNKPVYARDLKVHGAMTALLKDAFQPNLVQTIEGVPVIIHGGPFANIAHGCNSIRATEAALGLADYTVTEAGFGADLGAEKFLDIKCRKAGISPDAAVLVATVRAIKYNGVCGKTDAASLTGDDAIQAVKRGFANVEAHYRNLVEFGVTPVVAINKFPADTDEEIATLAELCGNSGMEFAVSTAFADGGDGSLELAEKVIALCDRPGRTEINFAYRLSDSTRAKIERIASRIYGADGVVFTEKAEAVLENIDALGYGNLPVCVAKTQYSFSDDQKKLGRPTGFVITVRDIVIQSGAGFIVALTGDIMTMPGFPKVPNAEIIDIDASGNIVNLS